MVTKKKSKSKSDGITMEMPGTIGGAKIVLPKEKKKKTKTKDLSSVVKGSHLTVITDTEGRTTLEWDDEALLRDVRAAILKAESTIPAATTKVSKPRKASAITARKKTK